MTTFAAIAAYSWLGASGAYALQSKKRAWIGDVLTILGILSGALLLGTLWTTMGRPPLRTLGETRWWYAVLVPTLGLLIGWRFNTRLLAIPACLMGGMFAVINLQHPELMEKSLMPALQSPWFVPHVVVYMVAYAALGLSSLTAAWAIAKSFLKKQPITPHDVDLPHRLVLVGLPLLTTGLIFGAFWAKEAWGHYWTWDPKETWAFISWAAYLTYLHVKTRHAMKPMTHLVLLIVGFAALLACWFGVNYLPTTAESVHTYTQS